MINFKEMVKVLSKDGDAILTSMDGSKAHLIHMTMGIAGESGELLDAIKKHIMYEKPLDMENVIEELGDIEFFLEGFRQALDISRDETITANIKKLGIRYSNFEYSDKKAQTRADKQ